MCLSFIDNTASAPAASGEGYKVFWQRNGKLFPQTQISDPSDPYDIGQWYVAYDLATNADPSYPLGFHVFLEMDDAQAWNRETGCVIRKVRWSHRLALGQQRVRGKDLRVVVAKEIMILRQPSSKANRR